MKGGITHAAYVTVHANIVQVVFGGLNLSGISFGIIAHIKDLFLSEGGVIIEVDLGIHAIDYMCDCAKFIYFLLKCLDLG